MDITVDDPFTGAFTILVSLVATMTKGNRQTQGRRNRYRFCFV